MLHECIGEGMKNLLGESGTKAVLFHLQLVQFAKNPKEFHENLRTIFKEGATVIERMIVKELFKKINVPYKERVGFNFERYVNIGRELFEEKQSELSSNE